MAERYLKWVENTAGKGEIACYEQFLLFSQYSLRTCKNQGLFGNGLTLQNDKILDWPILKVSADDNLNVTKMMISLYDKVGNIVGKGENASYQHFLLFSQCFQNTYTADT